MSALSAKGSTAVGVIVAVLIIGAVGVIGYYQVEVAPNQLSTGTTSTTSGAAQVNCQTTPTKCVNVTIVSGAGTPYSGYSQGSTTLYGYDPSTTTVVIGVNNTVVWTNKDVAFHTATSNAGDPASFESGCFNVQWAPFASAGVESYQDTFKIGRAA